MVRANLVTANERDEEEDLWRRLRSQDQAARERLFAIYCPYARSLARRQFAVRTRGDLELADLEQFAFEGLLQALDRFEPARQVPFRGFAAKRMLGSIADGVRRANEVREQMAWGHRMRQERLRSMVPSDNVAQMSALDALADLAIGLALGFMLEDTAIALRFERGDAPSASVPSAWQSLAWCEVKETLDVELANLGGREQMILTSHYLEGMAFDTIAALLGISKGRVSQIHRAALITLRKRMSRRGHFRLER